MAGLQDDVESGLAAARTGTLMLHPDPPHDPRWLTAIPGEPAVRIDLTRPPDTAAATASVATASPGEHLLHAVAARLLAAAAIPPAPEPGPLSAAADGLGDLIAALQEVIPPLSRATAWIEVLAAGQSAQPRATLTAALAVRFTPDDR